jgi:hypothetical protein
MIGNLSALTAATGRADESTRLFAESVAIQTEVGDRRGIGVLLGNRGVQLQTEGRLDEAGSKLTQALEIARELGDRRFEGVWTGNLASLARARGELALAGAGFAAAMGIAREIRDRRFEGIWMAHLGDLAAQAPDVARAQNVVPEVNLRRALLVHREVNDLVNESYTLGRLADLLATTEPPDIVRAMFDEALTTLTERKGGTRLTDIQRRRAVRFPE